MSVFKNIDNKTEQSIDAEIRVIIDKRVPYLTPKEVAVIDDNKFLECLFIRWKQIAYLIEEHVRLFHTKIHDKQYQKALSFINSFKKKYRWRSFSDTSF